MGPRVLIPLYVNAVLNAHLWGLPEWYLWPVYAIPEIIFVGASYLLFTHWGKGKCWLPNFGETTKYIVMGIVIPCTINTIYIETQFLLLNDHPADQFFKNILLGWLTEFISNLSITIPLLVFVTPFLYSKKVFSFLARYNEIIEAKHQPAKYNKYVLSLILFVLMFVLSLLIPFEKYWYLYGIIALFIAVKFSFRAAVVSNLIIFIITYFMPFFFPEYFDINQNNIGSIINIHVGMSLLSISALLVGILIADLQDLSTRLDAKNQQLTAANQDLDSFVYSISHDISAPLKSIKGLVQLSTLDPDPSYQESYITKISKSIERLEEFVKDVLSYSRNSRLEVNKIQFDLKELIDEILESLSYAEGYQHIRFQIDIDKNFKLNSDRLRVKIILNNLISNAIKFSQKEDGVQSEIHISARKTTNSYEIKVRDNGMGIAPEYLEKIFNMFYRATSNVEGSGLGLYIAQNATSKLKGTITVKSELNVGTEFTIIIPSNE